MSNPTGRCFFAQQGRKWEAYHDGVPSAPQGWQRLKGLGPSFLWMLSAEGSDELLFTPRITAVYGYSLIWAPLAAVVLKWFINREVGRFTMCTGATILERFKQLSGPKNWAVWLILIPQFFFAIATVAGLSGAAATALILLTGSTVQLWMIIIVVVTASITLLGQCKSIDKLASYLAVVLFIAGLTAALSVFPKGSELAAGLAPQLAAQVQYQEISPWLGFMLVGVAGLMWNSYWIEARCYGALALKPGQPLDPTKLSAQERTHLQGWLTQMTLSNTLAVVGGLLIAIALLILGGELLRPEGVVPQENQIAETLDRLLGNIWRPIGFWFMIVAVFVTQVARAIEAAHIPVVTRLYYGRVCVENAKLYSRPVIPPQLIGAAMTAEAAEWLGSWADGLITIFRPPEQLRKDMAAFRRSDDEIKPMYPKVQLSYAQDEPTTRQGAHEQWRINIFKNVMMEELDRYVRISQIHNSTLTGCSRS